MSLDYPEASLICVIMLRGSQTLGELKINAEKMHTFHSYDDLNAAMEILYEKNLITRLPRQPGQKEQRIANLLCGDSALHISSQASAESNIPSASDEIINEISAIKKELEELKASFLKFKSQFE